MRRHVRTLVARHEPPGSFMHHLKSGSGAVVGMSAVGGLSVLTGLPLLVAPLGATAVLVFGQPSSPLAQPANILGGYLVATVVAAGAMAAFPGLWPAAILAVGLSIVLMLALRITHPPAGAIPLVMLSAAPAEELLLFAAILLGSASLVGLGILHHWLPPRVRYPRPVD
jgi:CBS-domain-containing membrane protein